VTWIRVPSKRGFTWAICRRSDHLLELGRKVFWKPMWRLLLVLRTYLSTQHLITCRRLSGTDGLPTTTVVNRVKLPLRVRYRRHFPKTIGKLRTRTAALAEAEGLGIKYITIAKFSVCTTIFSLYLSLFDFLCTCRWKFSL
jgi:hypothetical protein